jgi:acyl dehydratase
MALNTQRLMQWNEPPLQHAWSESDAMRYALSLGVGSDPLDESALRFVYERGLQALPTMATVIAAPFGWLYRTDAGVTASHCVHAWQGLRMLRPLPTHGVVTGTLRVTGIEDKGAGRGALVHFERRLHDVGSGTLLCTLPASMFCRADGFVRRALGTAPRAREPTPETLPEVVADCPTLPQQALLFRLNGDVNPIHADPERARHAGFERPILHGLCTFGMVAYALTRRFAQDDTQRLVALDTSFAKPMFPGESLRIEAWPPINGVVRFRARVTARDAIVLSQGRAVFGRCTGVG